MMTRDKKIGKSTYRIIKENGRFYIAETYLDRMAIAAMGYDTMEDALQAMAAFDREKMIVGDK